MKPIKDQPKLLPCPFCGGKAEFVGMDDIGYHIRCENVTNCSIEQMNIETKERAVNRWNTRYE